MHKETDATAEYNRKLIIMKSLKPRLITAVIGIAVLFLVMIAGEMWPFFINIVVGLASAFMVGEYLNAKKLLSVLPLSILCMTFSFVVSLTIKTGLIYLVIAVFAIFAFSIMIAKHSEITYGELAYALTGTMLITFGMSSLSAICNGAESITFFYISAFTLPWMADAGGFFIGASFGKHKLCPNISPKKTVEGAVGGITFCLISAVLLGLLFQFVVMPNVKFNFWALLLLGAIDALVSILGDLSFSLIKRSLGIKDYGSVFPGHGGMLDRFDSIIFTVPVMLIINQYFPIIMQV